MKEPFDQLVDRYLEGTISSEELALLNARLLADAQARRDFSELLNLDAALGDLAEGFALDEVEATRVVAFPALLRWVPLAACIALLLVGAWYWRANLAFATVMEAAGVESLAAGTRLQDEPHVISVGSVELVTARGAQVIIEAPAEFRFESAQRLRMIRGRLAADVPPSAKGFTVITPTGEAIDLGTRFGVDVPASGPSEIHVFHGEVISRAVDASQRKSLLTGDAVTLDRGAGTTRELRSAAFIQGAEFEELSAGLAAGQRSRAESVLQLLRSDPDLIVLLDFESAEELPGTYRTVQGRWPGSHAPEFIHVGDHLKLAEGGERAWAQLTLAAWVRLDRLGAPYQSLLHTDGWDEDNLGQVHWMVTREMTMRLALRGNTMPAGSTELGSYPNSRLSVLPEQGRWVHLATVYDAQARTVRFYLNGEFDNEVRQEVAYPAKLGAAQIGNWNRHDRRLSGRVDELVILGRALDDTEIQNLFAAGNPYR